VRAELVAKLAADRYLCFKHADVFQRAAVLEHWARRRGQMVRVTEAPDVRGRSHVRLTRASAAGTLSDRKPRSRVRPEPPQLHCDPGQQRDQRTGGDDVHRRMNCGAPNERDALQQ